MANDVNKMPKGLGEAFKAIVSVAKAAFKGLPPGPRIAVAFAAFGSIMCLLLAFGLGIAGRIAAKDVVRLFILVLVFLLLLAAPLVLSEFRRNPSQLSHAPVCRRVPIYPPAAKVLKYLSDAIVAIQSRAHRSIIEKLPDLPIEKIRANLFLLAKMEDGGHKLVMHRQLMVNMDHPPEWNIQFSPGQGAAGHAFNTSTAGLTRRLSDRAGQWDKVQQLTPQLKALAHPDLKWIVTMPLVPSGEFKAIGVLNIDGIAPVDDDDVLLRMAAKIREDVTVIADYLNIQLSICVDLRVI